MNISKIVDPNYVLDTHPERCHLFSGASSPYVRYGAGIELLELWE